MSDTAVSKKASETPIHRSSSDVFQPMSSRTGLASLSPFVLSPFTMMREFANEMDRVFRGPGLGTEMQAWAPPVDIQQCDGNLVISAELPGVKREDIKVEVTGDTVTIQGERKQEHKEDHQGYHRWERNYGRFFRALPLPEGAKADQVKAELKDGILRVSIPVPDTSKKSRQVPVAG